MRFLMGFLVFAVQAQENKQDEIKALIQKLGDNDPVVREDAQEKLIKIGKPAYELIKETASKSKDIEVTIRAGKIRYEIEWGSAISDLKKTISSYEKFYKEDRGLELEEIESSLFFKNHKFFNIYEISKDSLKRVSSKPHYRFVVFKLNTSPFSISEGNHFDNLSKIIITEKIKISSLKEANDFFQVTDQIGFSIKSDTVEYFESMDKDQVVSKGYRTCTVTLVESKYPEGHILRGLTHWVEHATPLEFLLDDQNTIVSIRIK